TTGSYSVSGILTNGCPSSNQPSVDILVNPRPHVIITGALSFCQGDSTTLTASGADSYIWNTGSTSASIVVKTAGKFVVTGMSNGCSNASDSVTVTIKQVP